MNQGRIQDFKRGGGQGEGLHYEAMQYILLLLTLLYSIHSDVIDTINRVLSGDLILGGKHKVVWSGDCY